MQCAEDQEESQNTFKQITKGGETLLGKSGRWAPILFFILCTRTHRHVVVHVCDVTRSQANSFTCVQLSTDGCKMLKKHSNGVKKTLISTSIKESAHCPDQKQYTLQAPVL